MQLTHVYVNLGGKLKNVGVDDIGRMHHIPHLFCRLCGEYVSYVSASKNRRSFFKHSPNPGKTCRQKSDGRGSYSTTPIRQRSSTSRFFVRLDPGRLTGLHPSIGLELALPPVSESDRRILISARARFEVFSDGKNIAVYSADRLSERGRTYIPIEGVFASEYRLSLKSKRSVFSFSRFLNALAEGFDEEGMLFSMETGRRIPFQAEVYVGISYVWIGRAKHAPSWISDVDTERLERLPDGWVAVRVKARRHSNAAVVAFIRFGAALCEIGDIAYPLWPPFVRRDELVCIEPDQLRFWGAKADAVHGVVPDKVGGGGEFQCKQCDRLLYPVPFMYTPYDYRDKVARDVEIWKETFRGEALDPLVEVWDPDSRSDDVHVPFGEHDRLPSRRRLNFKARGEGHIEVLYGNGRQARLALKARDLVSLDVERGMSISVYQGLDLVGEIFYQEPDDQTAGRQPLSQAEKGYMARVGAPTLDGRHLARLAERLVDCPELHGCLCGLARGGVANAKVAAVVRKRLNLK